MNTQPNERIFLRPASAMRRLLTWPNLIVVFGMAVALITPMLGLILVVAGIWCHILREQYDGGKS